MSNPAQALCDQVAEAIHQQILGADVRLAQAQDEGRCVVSYITRPMYCIWMQSTPMKMLGCKHEVATHGFPTDMTFGGTRLHVIPGTTLGCLTRYEPKTPSWPPTISPL